MGEDIREQFERDGYIVARGVIDAGTVDALRSQFMVVFKQEKARVLFDAVLHYPEIFAVLKSPKLVGALTTLLGERFVFPPESSVTFNHYGWFHTDATGWALRNQTFYEDEQFRMVTVAIYLQDNDEHGGGIHLAPGSHKLPDRYVELTRRKHVLRQKLNESPVRRMLHRLSRGRLYDLTKPFREHERGVDVPSKAGDAIIWDMRLAHRASHPRVKRVPPHGGKLAIFFTCGANNLVTTEAYMKYVLSSPENEYLRKPNRIVNQTDESLQQFVIF